MSRPSDDPWAVPEPEPTTLIALWPGDRAPEASEVLDALRAHLGADVETLGEADPQEGVLWSVVVEVPRRDAPVIFWAEPSRKESLDDLDDPAARECRWVVGAETLLNTTDPLPDFAALLGFLAGSIPDSPAVLDANTGWWHARNGLDEHFGAGTPPEDALWITHVVQDDDDDGSSSVWLHTHGLTRCGRPDLEMMDVDGDRAGAAAELLSAIAGRVLEERFPPPGEPFPVGPDLLVTLHPWPEVAPDIGPKPGGMADRADEQDNAHIGVRAVVCAADAKHWPQPVLDRLGRGAVLYLSSAETERLSRSARARWPTFIGAFGSISPALLDAGAETPPVRFLVKAGMAEAAGGDQREHLWFTVRCLDGDRAEGRLMNEPATVRSMSEGDVTWIDRNTISDWSVETPLGSFGPGDAAAMAGALEALERQLEKPT